MSKSKKRNYLTETQIGQIKAILSETPDIQIKSLIDRLSLTITPSGLCHRLKRNKIPYKGNTVFTKEQRTNIKIALSENPDTPLNDLIEKLSLPTTTKELKRKLRSTGVLPKTTRTFLTKSQVEQVLAAISETPNISAKELIAKFSLPITSAGLRNRLRRMGIPYKGKKID